MEQTLVEKTDDETDNERLSPTTAEELASVGTKELIELYNDLAILKFAHELELGIGPPGTMPMDDSASNPVVREALLAEVDAINQELAGIRRELGTRRTFHLRTRRSL